LSASGDVQVNAEAWKLFAPLPVTMASPDNPVTDTKVELGRILYYDPRLSANRKISCNTCHPLDAYRAESIRVSTGHKNQKGESQRAYRVQRRRALRGVLGWPSSHCGGAG